jgi:hypothetical protein
MSVTTRMAETALPAVHITIALAVTMTVGVQSSRLARLRGDMPTPPAGDRRCPTDAGSVAFRSRPITNDGPPITTDRDGRPRKRADDSACGSG